MATTERVHIQDVRSAVGGEPLEQVLFDRYQVRVGPAQGGVMTRVKEGRRAADRVRPRRTPPAIRPRPVPGLLDRAQELGAIGQALARGLVVDLHGPDGMGKTALIGQTMQTQLPRSYPGGVVYLTAGEENYEDLLQELFARFYETDGNVKVSENDVRDYMAGKRALIAVDDANQLQPGQAEALAQVAPQCAVLIAGRKQQVWQGASVMMTGLPRDEAVALFERYWGRPLAADRPTAESICEALGNVPLAIIKAATIANTRQVPLAEMLYWLQTTSAQHDPMGRAFQVIARRFSEGERRVMAGLAAPGGATLDVDALAFITGLAPDSIGKYLNRLQKMRLVYADEGRYGLDDGLRPYIRQSWVDQAMRARAAEYYRRKAPQLRVHSKDPDEDNVLRALGYFSRQQQWRQVVEIARAVERYLAMSGRWGQWRLRLRQAWHAAQALGDRSTEAWAQNQLGIIAVSLGETAAAATLFKAALGIWRILGDRAGETIARWNLQVLLGPPPGPPPKGKPPAEPGGGSPLVPIALGTTAVVLTTLLILVIIDVFTLPTAVPHVLPTTAAVVLVPTRPPPTATTRPPVTTAPPPVTTAPPPVTTAPPPTTQVPITKKPPPTTPAPVCVCGDGFCDAGSPCYESTSNCPADCCLCGDGYCDAGSPCYESTSCPSDCCACGDGYCDAGSPCYELTSCPSDCCLCGDGVCDAGSPCYESTSCPSDCCVCGDGVCSAGSPCYESSSCPSDCCVCGDGYCDAESPCYESSSSCPADCPLPDLVVTTLETVGTNTVTSEGDIEVPIRAVIRNQGGAAAGIFKVSTEYSEYSGTFFLPFAVPGQDNTSYPYSDAALAPGDQLSFQGKVTFSYHTDDEIVTLRAEADSCSGEEFAEAYCRVLESDEDNNQSASIGVDVRGPYIYNVFTDPASIPEDEPVSISASISDGTGVGWAGVWYWYYSTTTESSDSATLPMQMVDDPVWRVDLGSFDRGELRYVIIARDEAGNETKSEQFTAQILAVID
jgi:hypothetical protein